MEADRKYDAIIIGFGKGGKTLAAKLAGTGKKVAMVEKDSKMYGGTCINVGCIPSKSFVYSSGIAALDKEKEFPQKRDYYRKAVEEKEALTGMLRQKNFEKLNSLEQVDIYNGTASFVSNTMVGVTLNEGALRPEGIEAADGKVLLEGEKIYINTGGTPVMPPIEGLKGNPYVYTSAELLSLPKLPEHLVIIGGGYIGMEFASMYAGFGSRVTVLQDGDTLLAREDRDVADAIRACLEEKGVTFCLGAAIHEAAAVEGAAEVRYIKGGKEGSVKGDAVLVAVGRRPNTDGLRAENAGVGLTSRGAVIVDDNLKTTAPNIWAMGDVTGGGQFTYLSLDDFRILWSGMNGGDYSRAKRKEVPYSVFITPPYSRVGMNETEAEKAGRHYKVMKLQSAAIPKAKVLRGGTGFLKAIVDTDTDRILGAMLFCEESYEMINLVKLAMDMDAPYQTLRDQIYTHPTMSEALNDLFAG